MNLFDSPQLMPWKVGYFDERNDKYHDKESARRDEKCRIFTTTDQLVMQCTTPELAEYIVKLHNDFLGESLSARMKEMELHRKMSR